MHLLVVTHYYPEHRGGVEIVAGELVERLQAHGVSITWAASDTGHTGPNRVPMRATNLTEHTLGFPYPLWSPASLTRLRRLVQSADVVHLHDALYFGNAIAARFAKSFRKPVVVTQHIGMVPYRNPLLRGMLAVANRVVAKPILTRAFVRFISPRVADYFKRFVPFERSPAYWPNGVHERFRPQTLPRAGVLFVGRFVEKKGLPLLRAAAEALPEVPFRFAGWGPIDPTAWRLPNVTVLGSLSASQLADIYPSAQLLALPSVGEGFPLVVQEAAACGTPALITRETAEGIPNIADMAILVEPTAEAVIAAIRSAMADPTRLRQLGDTAAVHARSTWNWDVIAAQYHTLFQTLTQSPSNSAARAAVGS